MLPPEALVGNKAGKRNTGRGRGKKRSSGAHGPKPPRGDADLVMAKKRRRVQLKFKGVETWSPPDPILSEKEKPKRNAPCACGSGKKLKACCGVRPDSTPTSRPGPSGS